MSNHSQVRIPLSVRNVSSQRNEQTQQVSNPISKHMSDRTSNTTANSKSTKPSSNATNGSLIRTWLCLPQSRFGIQYDLGSTKTPKASFVGQNLQTGICILQFATTLSPFEFKMQELKKVLEIEYSHGAGLVYVREFLEPQDPEFPHTQRALNAEVVVHVTDLIQEQVGRLRLLILSKRRQSTLVSALKRFASFASTSQVLDHYESFKQYYSKTRNHQKKMDAILALTIALCRFNGWMFQMNRGLGRSKMVEGLATRWKNLLATQTPAELELDESFSFPALLHILEDFKRFVETAPTYGDPKMVFKYYPAALASEYVA